MDSFWLFLSSDLCDPWLSVDIPTSFGATFYVWKLCWWGKVHFSVRILLEILRYCLFFLFRISLQQMDSFLQKKQTKNILVTGEDGLTKDSKEQLEIITDFFEKTFNKENIDKMEDVKPSKMNDPFTAEEPGGFTLHMTGYAPACTKSVEKGIFLDIRRRRRLLQKGYIFGC